MFWKFFHETKTLKEVSAEAIKLERIFKKKVIKDLRYHVENYRKMVVKIISNIGSDPAATAFNIGRMRAIEKKIKVAVEAKGYLWFIDDIEMKYITDKEAYSTEEILTSLK